jgi:hypothetical protein
MPASVQDLTDRSSFIFEGAVRQVGAVTFPGIQTSPEMAIVQITRILKGPSVLSAFAGREITVQLHEHETVREGLHALFFTNGLHFGDGLAVREVGRLDAGGRQLERQVEEALQRKSDDELLERLRRAELVVSGVAIATRRHEPAADTVLRRSEHDPDWWECVIEVESVEKGKLKSGERKKSAPQRVVTLFAKSEDVAWYRAPKFEKGTKGIWLLQRIELPDERIEILGTIHKLDFHPLSQLERIRGLLKRIER